MELERAYGLQGGHLLASLSTTSSGRARLPGIPECNKPPCIWRLAAGRRPSYGRTPNPIRELVNHMWRLERGPPVGGRRPRPSYNVKHKPTFGGGVLKVTPPAAPDIVRRCSAGAGPLTLEFLSLHKVPCVAYCHLQNRR